jgi:diphthamide synthase subunit DPH2
MTDEMREEFRPLVWSEFADKHPYVKRVEEEAKAKKGKRPRKRRAYVAKKMRYRKAGYIKNHKTGNVKMVWARRVVVIIKGREIVKLRSKGGQFASAKMRR